jgi:hypothetical protein
MSCDARFGFWLSGSSSMHIESSGAIGIISSSNPTTIGGTSVSIQGAANFTHAFSAPSTTITGNVFTAGLNVASYGMQIGNGQPKRITTRSVNTSYIDFDYTSGFIRIAANGGTMVNAVAYASDYRLKENIIPITEAESLSKIKDVNVYSFNFINNSKGECGVLAQELMDIIPECVHEIHDGYLGVNYHILSAHLINCIKNLNDRIELLEAR